MDEDKKFRYMLLSRLKSDFLYYFGNGNRNKKYLWAEDEEVQIQKMKELYNSFEDEEKPEWLTFQDILNFEIKILNK